METAKELYEKAYELHYKKENVAFAYYIYKKIINEYPNEPEARYANSQLANIESIPGFNPTSINKYVKEEANAYKSENKKIRENINTMLITSGFNFEGYIIKEYIKFISSEVVLGMGAFQGFTAAISNLAGTESNALKDKLNEAKNIVNDAIINQAANLGANAIIGVDIDYTMFGGELLGVIMSGTAVIVDKK